MSVYVNIRYNVIYLYLQISQSKNKGMINVSNNDVIGDSK